VNIIVGSGYLASIAGGYASWVVMSNIPIAVVAQQWPAARMLTLSRSDQDKTDPANEEITCTLSITSRQTLRRSTPGFNCSLECNFEHVDRVTRLRCLAAK
jgi:hypothetical protein